MVFYILAKLFTYGIAKSGSSTRYHKHEQSGVLKCPLDLDRYCLVGWMNDYNGHFGCIGFQFHVQMLMVLYIIWRTWPCLKSDGSCLECAVESTVKLLNVESPCCHISAGKMISLPIVSKATRVGDRLSFKTVSLTVIGKKWSIKVEYCFIEE